ncbi:MAG: hypothetical protein ACRDRA_09080 [Pseudonocardiaceae bacterium]
MGVEQPLPESTVHLFSAHELTQASYGMTLVAVCGEPVDASILAGSSCAPGCECDHQYCPECVRAAIRWNAQPVADDRRG